MNPPADGPDERERRLTAAADALRALPSTTHPGSDRRHRPYGRRSTDRPPSNTSGRSPVRIYHGAMVATWVIYTAVWAISYAVPMPEALFTVKALIGVSLLTALEGSAGALHAAKAAQ